MNKFLNDLGPVKYEESCVVEEDPGDVVRGSRPLTPEDKEKIETQRREQEIAKLKKDPAAIEARERRIEAERGNTHPKQRNHGKSLPPPQEVVPRRAPEAGWRVH